MVLSPIKFYPSIKSLCECKTAEYEPNVNSEVSAFDIYFRREFRPLNDCPLDNI